jgi:hypothetical protein
MSRRALLLLLPALLAGASALAADTEIRIAVVNDADLPEAQLQAMVREYSGWARKVYRYNYVTQPRPVTLRLSRDAHVAMYGQGEVLMPPDDDPNEMLESWIHELTHHATGQDSSFFFKEGIATHTLEALFLRENRMPQGWANYGHTTDEWVSLFLQRGKLPPLKEALAWPHYQGDTADADFRSWQIYLAGGSFCGWYLSTYGYPHFREAFVKEWPAEDSGVLEKAWLASVRAQKLKPFDPAKALPDSPRYRAFVERLR